MPANAHLAQAERAKLRLEATDLREPLSRHLGAVGNPARQARARGLVPDSETQEVREPANIGLAKAALYEHASHVRIRCRIEPGTIVAKIVDVGSVNHVIQAALCLLLVGDVVKLGLAVKAAVSPVGNVTGPRDFPRFYEFVAGANLLGDRNRSLFFERSKARRNGRHTHGAASKDLVGHEENKSAVYPPRKAHQGATHSGEHLAKRKELGTVEILEIVGVEAFHVFPFSTAFAVSLLELQVCPVQGYHVVFGPRPRKPLAAARSAGRPRRSACWAPGVVAAAADLAQMLVCVQPAHRAWVSCRKVALAGHSK